MSTRRTVLLVGAAAGSGRAAALVGPVCQRLARDGGQVVLAVGRDEREAAGRLTTALESGVDAVVALGGDGTASLALQAVAGTPVPLGLVPAGSGNDIARMLGLTRAGAFGRPGRLAAALAAADVVRTGRTATLDAGRADGRWFLSVLGAGFEAVVARRARDLRRPGGAARYPAAAVAALPRLRAHRYRLVLDRHAVEEDAVLVALGNGPSYGGGIRICPRADPLDGLLDVTLVRPLSVPRLAALLPRLYAGRHLAHPAVVTHRSRVVRLGPDPRARHTPMSPHVPLAWADGEPVGPLPLTVECVPRAVRLLVP